MDVTLEYLAISSIIICTCALITMGMIAQEALPDTAEGDWRRRQWE